MKIYPWKDFGALVYAHAVVWLVAGFVLWLTGCAALRSVTPADRAAAYKREAQALTLACKAYAWDRQQGLVGEVPEMTEACE